MLASGFEYIGIDRQHLGLGLIGRAILEAKQPLHVEVLLLDPSSRAAGERDDLDPSATKGWYANGIKAVIAQLAAWKKANPSWRIDLYLYQEPPIWQMVVLGDDELWLLCAAGSTVTNMSPVYQLALDSPYGLAWGFMAVWGRRKDGARHVLDMEAEEFRSTASLHDIRSR